MAYKIPTQFLNTNPNSKATFRPGGDAAYVSYLLGGMINWIADYDHQSEAAASEDFQTEYHRVARAEAQELGFSPALQAKFVAAADRILAKEVDRQNKALLKAAKKSAKAQKREVVEVRETEIPDVKVGRWTYPVREVVYSDGTVLRQRNEKRDTSGAWIDLPA